MMEIQYITYNKNSQSQNRNCVTLAYTWKNSVNFRCNSFKSTQKNGSPDVSKKKNIAKTYYFLFCRGARMELQRATRIFLISFLNIQFLYSFCYASLYLRFNMYQIVTSCINNKNSVGTGKIRITFCGVEITWKNCIGKSHK